MEFNRRSRKLNAVLASSSGIIQQIVLILGSFVYRTIFLSILSKEYMGINGLFFNLLQLFSLTELGIGSAILYSMYKPVAQQDTKKLAALVRFNRNAYYVIAAVIFAMGMCFMPFVKSLVDTSEVPADVNLYVVYFLFLMETVTGYLFTYRQTVLNADQKSYQVFLFESAKLIMGYIVRAAVLVLSRDFQLVLLCGISSDFVLNWIFSIWIGRKYPELFRNREVLPKEEKRVIFKNTAGLMCHRIGNVAVNSTASIVLSKFVSLAVVGMYSNYSTIVVAITNVASRIFVGILPIVSNFAIGKSKEETHKLFNRLLFANLWMASFTSVCLFLLLNPFITVWLDESFLFTQGVVAMICLQHYLQVARLTANNFINSCGLFMRDKVRPLIECTVNLVVSVVLVQKIGIAGVFVGTCLSGALTYFWREPYLVFRNFFGKGLVRYWLTQALWLILTIAMCVGGTWLFAYLPGGFLGFVLKTAIAGIGSNLVIFLLTFRSDECQYFLHSFLKKK